MADENDQDNQFGSDDADNNRDSQDRKDAPIAAQSSDIVPNKLSEDQSLDQLGSSTQRFGYDSGSRLEITTGRSEDLKRMSKTDKYSSKAKIALGSTIDIRRASLAGDVLDRKTVRYMNTYKLESDNPFNPEKVDKILKSVMFEALENLTYDHEKCPKQAKWASMAIRAKVKELEFERYKIICIVTIGEKNSQDVLATCRFLWDTEKDRYSIFSLENTYVFGVAQCFGLYYE